MTNLWMRIATRRTRCDYSRPSFATFESAFRSSLISRVELMTAWRRAEKFRWFGGGRRGRKTPYAETSSPFVVHGTVRS